MLRHTTQSTCGHKRTNPEILYSQITDKTSPVQDYPYCSGEGTPRGMIHALVPLGTAAIACGVTLVAEHMENSQSLSRSLSPNPSSQNRNRNQNRNPRRSQTADFGTAYIQSEPNSHRHSSPSVSGPSMSMTPAASNSARFDESRRAELRRQAEETLTILREETFTMRGVDYELAAKIKETKKSTKFYSPTSNISRWASTKPRSSRNSSAATGVSNTHIAILQISTLDAARLLQQMYKNNPEEHPATGILNFASATKPGGGFKNGAEAQEESIARSSTLYLALRTEEAQQFYALHEKESGWNLAGYYSHAMIYSPKVTVFRDDDGRLTYPFEVDVLTCAAVNAGDVRKSAPGVVSGIEVGIEKEMTERMGRILYLFEQQGMKNIVLGTFGTGVFRNQVATVARIWAHLLLVPDARFRDSFDRIIFAITGEETYVEFQSTFSAWGQQRAPGLGLGQPGSSRPQSHTQSQQHSNRHSQHHHHSNRLSKSDARNNNNTSFMYLV